MRAEQVIEAAHAVHQGSGPHSHPVSDPNGHLRVAGYRDLDTASVAHLRPLRATQDHIDAPIDQAGRA